ncbi:DNA replication/repair protein RecF [Sporolituus thermophilus]|uniref:DNA replication and repair protein RecF n=1 Tax=Sporolituus thermophilus DSM 23256 TaxID=1123285 RepID=A0A1G7LXB2_9FIRM|nr:DNA replication/repair protein RecF [Sporolituus thermophilus]SDF54021.1 DNA replication and repair protein RecF [Sporolituus thermophilus DSM 23256]
MRVTRLVLRNFRNYAGLTLEFARNINIFIGRNAQGKTNILEALYLGAMGRSHRTAVDNELVRWGQGAALVEIAFTKQEVEHKLAIRLIPSQNKEILHNGHPIKQRELVGTLNAVLFSPEDLQLVKGAPALRRRFLDGEISQVSRAYYRALIQYNRVVQQRNSLLKKVREREAKADLIDAWDEQLAAGAAFLVGKRFEAVRKLAMLANLMHRRITASKENLSLSYYQPYLHPDDEAPKPLSSEWYRRQLTARRAEDIARGTTTIGPHRDDLLLAVNGHDLRVFGSQGQQRTGALALKLAELEFIKSETGEYPLLLLDDVMSELDEERRSHLLYFIRERIQTFITATDAKYFPDDLSGQYYQVAGGAVREVTP